MPCLLLMEWCFLHTVGRYFRLYSYYNSILFLFFNGNKCFLDIICSNQEKHFISEQNICELLPCFKPYSETSVQTLQRRHINNLNLNKLQSDNSFNYIQNNKLKERSRTYDDDLLRADNTPFQTLLLNHNNNCIWIQNISSYATYRASDDI